MSLLDLEALLAPISASAPAGENLEYTPEFAALEEAAIGKPVKEAALRDYKPDAKIRLIGPKFLPDAETIDIQHPKPVAQN